MCSCGDWNPFRLLHGRTCTSPAAFYSRETQSWSQSCKASTISRKWHRHMKNYCTRWWRLLMYQVMEVDSTWLDLLTLLPLWHCGFMSLSSNFSFDTCNLILLAQMSVPIMSQFQEMEIRWLTVLYCWEAVWPSDFPTEIQRLHHYCILVYKQFTNRTWCYGQLT